MEAVVGAHKAFIAVERRETKHTRQEGRRRIIPRRGGRWGVSPNEAARTSTWHPLPRSHTEEGAGGEMNRVSGELRDFSSISGAPTLL